MTIGYTPEPPFAPDLGALLQTKLDQINEDNLTQRQNALTRAIDYIHKTKTVIGALHDNITVRDALIKQQRELLKHCLSYIENPKPRNQDLIVKAIKQHLEFKK
jgi:hypothetical protein